MKAEKRKENTLKGKMHSNVCQQEAKTDSVHNISTFVLYRSIFRIRIMGKKGDEILRKVYNRYDWFAQNSFRAMWASDISADRTDRRVWKVRSLIELLCRHEGSFLSELILYFMLVFVDFSSPREILQIDYSNSHSLTRATVYMIAMEGTRVIKDNLPAKP